MEVILYDEKALRFDGIKTDFNIPKNEHAQCKKLKELFNLLPFDEFNFNNKYEVKIKGNEVQIKRGKKIGVIRILNDKVMYMFEYGLSSQKKLKEQLKLEQSLKEITTLAMEFQDMLANQEIQFIEGDKGLAKIKNSNSTVSVTSKKATIDRVKKIYISNRQGLKRNYNHSVDQWQVRGFWRTYKSGKKVWIKSQTRHSKSDGGITKEKTYKIK